MEIKITILQEGKQAISREFTSLSEASAYLVSISPEQEADTVGEKAEEVTVGGTAPTAYPFTNEQRFEIGETVIFHQLTGEFAGEHIIEEEREEEVGHSYRTNRSRGVFVHAHWFSILLEPTVEETA